MLVNVGGILSSVHVTVLEVLLVFPHPSPTVNVLVRLREQDEVMISPSVGVIVVVPQPSVADAVPKAASMSEARGLQPNANVVPFALICGGVLSSVHVTVRDLVAVFPHSSVAVNVLVKLREQVEVLTDPSLGVIVVAPHPSVAFAVPNAAAISDSEGLQANGTVA